MKKFGILLALTIISIFPISSIAVTFGDTAWIEAEESINKVTDMGIMSGYDDSSFKPNEYITRAEFAEIITKAFGLNEKSPLEEYNDLDRSAEYYPYLQKSAKYIPKYGIMFQYDAMRPYRKNAGGGFLPECYILRMHAAEALSEIKIEMNNLNMDIPDIVEIQTQLVSDYKYSGDYDELYRSSKGNLRPEIVRMFKYTWLASKLGIMKGADDGSGSVFFNPYGYMTRAELAEAIAAMLK